MHPHHKKNFIKYGILLPVAIFWQTWLWIITKIYHGTQYIDRAGENFLEKNRDLYE